jgi:hypothetical protein
MYIRYSIKLGLVRSDKSWGFLDAQLQMKVVSEEREEHTEGIFHPFSSPRANKPQYVTS